MTNANSITNLNAGQKWILRFVLLEFALFWATDQRE
ncbi:MAG: hypothetical protein ACI8UQ_002041 [Bacteroidia bacterium]|jgi:hypothetical protein